MKRRKLIFVVVFMVCSFMGGRLFAGYYHLEGSTYSVADVIDSGLNDTIGTDDYADGLDTDDSVGYRLDCSIGPLGHDEWMIESSLGTILESGFYLYHSTWIANPTFVFEVTTTTIKFQLESHIDPELEINPSWTQYAIAFSSGVTLGSLFESATFYIKRSAVPGTFSIVDYFDDADEYWNTASFYEEIKLTGLNPNTIYGFKIKSKLPPEINPTDWSGDTDNFTWTHIETPDINVVDVYITTATVIAGSFSNLGAGQSGINFSTGSWTGTGWIAVSSYTFTGLDPNTSYTFQVQAQNGEMYPTEVDSTSTYTLCYPPEKPYITDVSSTSLTLGWKAPWEGSVNYYRIEEKDAGLIQDNYEQLSLYIDNLSPNTSYTYTIYAVNESSETHPMSSVSISTYTKCSIPPAPQIVDVSSDTIKIVLYEGSDPGDNPPHTEYSIRVYYSVIESTRYVSSDYTPVDDEEVFQTITKWENPLTIINLTSNVTYTISVQARNYNGVVTGYGDSVSTHTPCAAPRLQFLDIKEDSASILIVQGNNSDATKYAIFVEREEGGMWPDLGYLTDGAHIGDVADYKTWHTRKEWDELYEQSDRLEIALDLQQYSYRFHIYTRDSLDNEIEWPEYFVLTEITKSWITVNFPVEDRFLGGFVKIQWNSSKVVEEVDIYYSNDGGTSFDKIVSTDSAWGVPIHSYLWDTTTVPDGNYIIKIEDRTGSGVGKSGEFTIDNTPPRFTVTSVSPNPAKDEDLMGIDFNIVEDNLVQNTLRAWVILSTWTTQDEILPKDLRISHADYSVEEDIDPHHGGEKQIHFYVEDLAGNTTDYYFPVVFDFEPPLVNSYNLVVGSDTIAIEDISASDDDFWASISTDVAKNTTSYFYICDGDIFGWTSDNSHRFEGLLLNKKYNLYVSLKDAAWNENSSAISISTYTLCVTPGPPSIEEVYASSMTVKIELSGNPEETTRFSLAISSSAVTYYVKPDGSFDLNVTTATYSELGGDTGVTITGLNPTTEYTLKCRAMNNSGRPTDWSTTASSSTLCGPIEIEAFKLPAEQTYDHEWTNVTDFRFVLTGASSYYYILRDVPDIPASYPNDIDGNEVDISINSGIWYAHFKGVNPTETDETTGYYEVKVDTTLPELDIDSIKAEIHGEVLDPKVEHSSRKPIFTWDAASDSFSGVNGYSISFSTNIGDGPNYDIDTTTNSIEREPKPLDQDATYYFKVKAIDNAGNSSQVGEFVYKYKADLVFPWVKSIDVENKRRIGNEVKGVERKNTLPEITFTEKVWYVEDYVEVELIRDNEGKDISGNVSCAINDEGKRLWKIDPGPGEDWESNHTYKIKVSTGIEDEAGHSLKEGKELIFTTMLDHTKRNVIMWESEGDPEDPNAPKTKMILEANALKEDGYILINLEPLPLKKGGGAKEVKQVNPEAIIEADEKMKRSGDRYCYNLRECMKETSGYTTEGGEMVIDKFLNSVYIELPYADEDKDGRVDSTQETSVPVSVKTLSVYWLDEEHRLWVKISGTEVDKEANVARAKVIGFGVYTLMGGGFYDLSDAYAYPVPYKPNDGLSTTGDETNGITFTNLSTEAEIKIYTITGELVKKLVHKNGPLEEWYPVENEKGEKVVSGVYIYYIENQKQHKSGKLVIIR